MDLLEFYILRLELFSVEYIDEIPNDFKIHVVEEEALRTAFQWASWGRSQKKVVLWQKSKLGKRELSSLQRRLVKKEFFPGDQELGALKTQLLAHTWGLWGCLKRGKEPKDPVALLRAIWEEILISSGRVNYNFFSSILFFYCRYIDYSEYETSQSFIRKLKHLVEKLSPEKWLGIKEFWLYLASTKQAPLLNERVFSRAQFERYDPEFEEKERKYIAYDYENYLHLPFLKGFFFLLSALGLAEIAYTDPAEDRVSPYDSLLFVRLTPLGQPHLERRGGLLPPGDREAKGAGGGGSRSSGPET